MINEFIWILEDIGVDNLCMAVFTCLFALVCLLIILIAFERHDK